MTALEKGGVAQAFIGKIVIYPMGRRRVADVELYWRDGTSEKFILPYRADKWVLWLPPEVELLRQLIVQDASQVAIAKALPKRNWIAIRIKAYEIVGKRSFQISPKPIRDHETYALYIKQLDEGSKLRKHNSVPWQPDEIDVLESLMNKGATQLEYAAALPHRSWQGIRQKISAVGGTIFKVPGPRPLGTHETFTEYVERNPTDALAMQFLILTNLSPR